MRVGLLGTGFRLAHAGTYHTRPDVESVVVFGRTASKLAQVAADFGVRHDHHIDRVYDDPRSTWSTSVCPRPCTPTTSSVPWWGSVSCLLTGVDPVWWTAGC